MVLYCFVFIRIVVHGVGGSQPVHCMCIFCIYCMYATTVLGAGGVMRMNTVVLLYMSLAMHIECMILYVVD